MRAVVQRVKKASVSVEGKEVSAIGRGILVFLGVGKDDTGSDLDAMAGKVAGLRIFPGDAGESDVSVLDAGGAALVVSQFTLLGDVRKGKRPSFSAAMEPVPAEAAYERFCDELAAKGLAVKRGVFRAMMDVELVNDGPYTILLDSKKAF